MTYCKYACMSCVKFHARSWHLALPTMHALRSAGNHASPRPWPAYQTHRRRETKDSGESISGRGQRRQMFLSPGADNRSYALHQPSSANVAASVCLYRKHERSLRCRPIVRPRPMVGLWSPIPGGRSAIAFPACVSTRAPQRQRPGC